MGIHRRGSKKRTISTCACNFEPLAYPLTLFTQTLITIGLTTCHAHIRCCGSPALDSRPQTVKKAHCHCNLPPYLHPHTNYSTHTKAHQPRSSSSSLSFHPLRSNL